MVLLCFANLCSPSFQFVYFNVFGSITCFLFICSSFSVLYETVIDANMLCCNPSMQHVRDGSKAVPYCTRDSFVFSPFGCVASPGRCLSKSCNSAAWGTCAHLFLQLVCILMKD